MIKNSAHKKLNKYNSPDPYGENLSFSLWLMEHTKDIVIKKNQDLDVLTYDYYLYQQQISRETVSDEDEKEFVNNKKLYEKYNNELKSRFNECLKYYNNVKLNSKGKLSEEIKASNFVSKTLSIVCNDFNKTESNFEESDKFITSSEAAEIKIAMGALMSCLFKPNKKYSLPTNLTAQDLFVAKIMYTELNKKQRTYMRDCIYNAKALDKVEKNKIINEHLGAYFDFVAFCRMYDIINPRSKKDQTIDLKNCNIKAKGYSKDGLTILLEVKDKNKIRKGTNIDQLVEIAKKYLTQEMYKEYDGKKEQLDKLIWENYPEFEGIYAKAITEALPMLLIEHNLGVSEDEHYKHTVVVDSLTVGSENESRRLKLIKVGNDYIITNTQYDESNKIRNTAQGLQSDGLYFKYNPSTGKYIVFVSEPAAYENIVKFLEKEVWNSSNSDHLLFNIMPCGLNDIERFHIMSSGPVDDPKDLEKIKKSIRTHYQNNAPYFNVSLSFDFISNKNMDEVIKIITSKDFKKVNKYLNSSLQAKTRNYGTYLEWKKNPQEFEKRHNEICDLTQEDYFFFKLYSMCDEDDEVYQKIAPLFNFYRNKNAKRRELYNGCYKEGAFEQTQAQLDINDEMGCEEYDLNNPTLKEYIYNLKKKEVPLPKFSAGFIK